VPVDLITILPSDKVGIDFRGFHAIEREGVTHYYNPKYYRLPKPRQPKPKTTPQPQPDSNKLKSELKQLTNTDRLSKKLNTYFRNLNRLRYLSGDDRIRKLKHITNAKRIIQSYLRTLKADPNFELVKSEKGIYLVYMGDYARTRRAVVI
jgi:hypothetical protein